MVGLVAALGFFAVIGMSAKFSSSLVVGIFSAVVIEMLAVGLIAGASHCFEEVHELREMGETELVWGDKKMDKRVANTVKVFRFFGLAGKMSEVQFGTWITAIILLTYLQISHNYFGIPLPSLRNPCPCFCAQIPTPVAEEVDELEKEATEKEEVELGKV